MMRPQLVGAAADAPNGSKWIQMVQALRHPRPIQALSNLACCWCLNFRLSGPGHEITQIKNSKCWQILRFGRTGQGGRGQMMSDEGKYG